MTEIEIEVKFKPIKDFLKKYWVPLLLLVVFILSMYIRLFNFHWPYLLNIDSYFQYRRMEYIINGHTELLTLERNGQLINSTDLKYDPLMIAPNGAKLQFTAYQYFGAYTYMLIHLLFPNLPFWRFLIYLPAFLASLMVIPAYYLGKVIYDRKAGIIFAFLSVFNPAIMSRTLGGDPDSDAWVLLWPLIVLALYFITYKTIDGNLKNKKSIILSILTGIAFTIFAYSWVSWYIFYLIIGFVVLVSILKYILRENRKQIIHILLSTFIIFLTFFIISYPISGLEKINANIFGPFNSLKLKSEAGQFPNVYVSVAELMSGGNLHTIATRVGVLLFLLGTLSIALLVYLFYKKRMEDPLVLLGIWIIAPLYASWVAIRFTILLALPLSLGASILLSWLWAKSYHKEDKSNLNWFWFVLALLLTIGLAWSSIYSSYLTAKYSGPVLTDNWWNAMNWIRDNTLNCSTIATYWDPGHFITGIAKRPCVFDGASQNTVRTVTYEGNLTRDEIIKKIGIENFISKTFVKDGKVYTNVTTERIQDIATVLLTDNETQAVTILKRYVIPRCNNSMYFIASSDLIGKSQWWSYFSTWSPKTHSGHKYFYYVLRLGDTRRLGNKTVYVYPITETQAILVTLGNNTINVYMQQNQELFSVSEFSFLTNNGFKIMKNENSTIPGLIWIDPSLSLVIYVPEELKNSLFTRMYLFNGQGLKHFKFVKNFGGEVKLFKVIFD